MITIDKMLEESFKGTYYIDFLKELFPDPNQLVKVETWGGEPTLGWHRMYDLFRDIIKCYPNFLHYLLFNKYGSTKIFRRTY